MALSARVVVYVTIAIYRNTKDTGTRQRTFSKWLQIRVGSGEFSFNFIAGVSGILS